MSPEKENTFRALRDEPLLMTRFMCKFGFHKWTRYDEPKRIKREFNVTSSGSFYYATNVQEKSCVSCNIKKYRTYKVPCE